MAASYPLKLNLFMESLFFFFYIATSSPSQRTGGKKTKTRGLRCLIMLTPELDVDADPPPCQYVH